MPSDIPVTQASGCSKPGFSKTTDGEDMVNVSKDGQVFRCEICGNVVVVKEAGGGELICCGEPMVLEE
jgi:desulfoferrodoxin-like iron-binding protein